MTAMFVSSEVRDLCRMGRTTLHNRLNPKSPGFDRDFPQPVALSPRRNAWLVCEVEAYLALKASQRTNFPK